MKKIVLLLFLLSVSFLSFAQNQVATLQHNDTITGVFYGTDAFASAVNVAVDGDVITLSSGTFNQCEITKAITVHGAGCVEDTVMGIEPTIIIGLVSIGNTCNTMLTFEGIRFDNIKSSPNLGWNSQNIVFQKCMINNLKTTNTYTHVIVNLQLLNCIVKYLDYYGCSALFENSVLHLTSYSNSYPNLKNGFYNTLLVCNDGVHLNDALISNSIIATGNNNSVSSTSFHNCIGIQTVDSVLFEGQLNTTNMTVNSYEEVFETFAGEVTFDNIYQLKQNVASSFLGHDGTEVGIYGGVMPYRTRPNYMIIKNCNVAGRTTEDNKLSVEIELFNAGE